MPLPVLAGLSWFGGLLTSALAGLFAWFIQFFTRRTAILAAGVVLLVTLTTAFMAGCYALLAGIQAAAPSFVDTAFQLFVPGNLGACVGAMMSARALKWAYLWQVRLVDARMA